MRILAGRLKGRPLKAPKGETTRPTSSKLRESLFNICREITEGGDVLDLCSGSGAIGIEALSRGANSATFVDPHPKAIQALKENLDNLALKGRVLKADALKAVQLLTQEKAQYDLIYIDPPYEAGPKQAAGESSLAMRLLRALDASSLLKADGILFLEEGGEIEGLETLKSLKLKKVRPFGKSVLYEFFTP
ncbi:MAG: 16S rRNA (guanine(966)-N(2))-methyltransferase RsmD [Chlamydiia bacterium]|nr:16S rRNA (guanine(966)-N(2))-methyltransferase RsmD [Chlamydiia bacterium]